MTISLRSCRQEIKKLRIKTQFSILLYAGINKEEFIDDYEHDLVK